jgi:hypothetical protein
MNIGATFVSDPQPALLKQPRNGPLHGPAVDAQSAAVFGPTLRQDWDNMSLTQLAAVGLGVIGPVPLDTIRTAARPSTLACNRRDRIDQRQQLRDVVAIGGRDLDRQGDALCIRDQMVLGARFASIRGIWAGLGPPKTARIESESTNVREKSIWSAPRSSRSKTLWTWLQTPASCQSRRRRQQVIPLPQPISLGRRSHWMPLLRTNKMPVSTARLARGFRPGYRNRRFFTGSKGLINSHSRSSNSGFAISSSLYLSSPEEVKHIARY